MKKNVMFLILPIALLVISVGTFVGLGIQSHLVGSSAHVINGFTTETALVYESKACIYGRQYKVINGFIQAISSRYGVTIQDIYRSRDGYYAQLSSPIPSNDHVGSRVTILGTCSEQPRSGLWMNNAALF